MTTLPYWLIAKKAGHNAGQRLPKWVKYEAPKVNTPVSSYYNTPPGAYKGAKLQQQTVRGEHGDDHRFWAIDGTGTWECRACQAPYWLEDDRKLHLQNEGCAKVLVAAYKLLLRDMRCVICDEHVTHTRWGVPICIGGNCIDRWLKEAQPDALTHALVQAELVGYSKYLNI